MRKQLSEIDKTKREVKTMKCSRFVAILAVLLLALVASPNLVWGQAPPSICQNVPEAASATLVYSLPIPASANYNNGSPPYSVDNTTIIGSFDRVAYCLELDNDWVWVSMDAFTSDPVQLGVPVISTGATFQQTVSNMNVFSNVPSIVTGTEITTGNIEFWHHCYITNNEIGIPGASSGVYDFGDDNRHNSSCYGSMQVHNYGEQQTLFAYNRWDGGGSSDLGIGNSPGPHPDWTFRQNAGTYATKILHVYVLLSNQPPVAVCQGAVVAIGEVPDIDGGSYDPDAGDTITLSQSPSGAFTEAGIYDVVLTVTDSHGATASCTAMVVVYDPSGGFVTGGGWIWSPAGAYAPDPTLEGKANFGFISKYKKGATVPTGQTEFVFQTGDLNFHSSSYDWLVVTGSDYARFKGWGSINGEGDYRFMIWAGDDPDTFRIKIWWEDGNTENVVYDNGMDQDIGRGSIVVHVK